jgi:putative CocE/NonD family hydrolase
VTQTGTEKPTTIDMEQALQGIHYGKNVPIPTRDGSYVSANIFRPDTTEQVPALLCYSIYAKDLHEQDGFPEIWADMLERLPNIFEHSTCSLHTHETNDPEIWCPWGYACVRVDVPGAGKSPGFLDPFSPAEARAGYDAVEWIAAQPWSNGKVGMTGISYLAIAQWRVATEQPPHLAAIVPWEGVSDYYRDWNRHGGSSARSSPAGTGCRRYGCSMATPAAPGTTSTTGRRRHRRPARGGAAHEPDGSRGGVSRPRARRPVVARAQR